MSVALDRFCFMVPLAKPSDVVLSTWIGVGACECPNYLRVVTIGTVSWPFKYPAPISASAADPTTTSIILHMVCIGPLSGGMAAGGCFGSKGLELKNKCPAARLRARVSERHLTVNI
jgi:hypothetical protein